MVGSSDYLDDCGNLYCGSHYQFPFEKLNAGLGSKLWRLRVAGGVRY